MSGNAKNPDPIGLLPGTLPFPQELLPDALAKTEWWPHRPNRENAPEHSKKGVVEVVLRHLKTLQQETPGERGLLSKRCATEWLQAAQRIMCYEHQWLTCHLLNRMLRGDKEILQMSITLWETIAAAEEAAAAEVEELEDSDEEE